MKKTPTCLSPARKTSNSDNPGVAGCMPVFDVGWPRLAAPSKAWPRSSAIMLGGCGGGHPLDPHGRDLGGPRRLGLPFSPVFMFFLPAFYRRIPFGNAVALRAGAVLPPRGPAPLVRFVLGCQQEAGLTKTGLLANTLFWFRAAGFFHRLPLAAPSFYNTVATAAAYRAKRMARNKTQPRFSSTAAVYALLRDLQARKRRSIVSLLRQQDTGPLRRRYAYAPPAVQAHVPFRHRPAVSHFVHWYGQKFVDPVLEPLVALPQGYKSRFLTVVREHRVRIYPARPRRGGKGPRPAGSAFCARSPLLSRRLSRVHDFRRALAMLYLKRRLARGAFLCSAWPAVAPGRRDRLAFFSKRGLRLAASSCALAPARRALVGLSRLPRVLPSALKRKRARGKNGKRRPRRPAWARGRGRGFDYFGRKEQSLSPLKQQAFVVRWRYARFKAWVARARPASLCRSFVSFCSRRFANVARAKAKRRGVRRLLRQTLASTNGRYVVYQPFGLHAGLAHLRSRGSRPSVFVKRTDHAPFVPFQLLLRRRSPRSFQRPSSWLVSAESRRLRANGLAASSTRRLAAGITRACSSFGPRLLAFLSSALDRGFDALFYRGSGVGRSSRLPLLWLQACALGIGNRPIPVPPHEPTKRAVGMSAAGELGRVVLTHNSHSVFLTVSEPSGRVSFQTTAAAVLRAHKKHATKRRASSPVVSFKFRRANFRRAYGRLLQEGLGGTRSKQARRKQMKVMIRQTKGRRRKRYPQGRAVRITGDTMRPLFQVLERAFAGVHNSALLARMVALSRASLKLEAKLTKLQTIPASRVILSLIQRVERRLRRLSQLESPMRVWGFRGKRGSRLRPAGVRRRFGLFIPKPRRYLGKVFSKNLCKAGSVSLGLRRRLRATKRLLLASPRGVGCAPLSLSRKGRRSLPDVTINTLWHVDKKVLSPSFRLLCRRVRLVSSGLMQGSCLRARWQHDKACRLRRPPGARGVLALKRFCFGLGVGKRFLFCRRRALPLPSPIKRAPGPRASDLRFPRDYVFVVRGFNAPLVRRAVAWPFSRLLDTLTRRARASRFGRFKAWLRARLYRLSGGNTSPLH